MKHRFLATASISGALVALALTGCSASASGADSTGNASSSSTAADANPYNLLTPGQLLVAVSGAQPPFDQTSASGAPQGYDIDLVNSFAKSAHLTVKYQLTDASSGIQGVSAKRYDMIADGLGVTAQRAKSIEFTKGIYWATTAFMTHKNSDVTQPSDLAGKHVAVVTGSVQAGYLAKIPGAIAVDFPSANAAVSALNSGTVDAFIVGEPSAPAYIKQFPDLKVAATQPVDHPTAFAVQLGNDALANAFNAHVATLVKNGTFLSLYKKYFGNAPSSKLQAIWPGLG